MDVTSGSIRLRHLAQEDLDDLLRMWTDADVALFMGDYARDESSVRDWLECVTTYNDLPGEGHNCAITDLHTGDFLGWIGFGRPSKPRPGEFDFGYAVLPEHRGCGIATAALRAVLDHCFDIRGASSVYGECHVDNAASAKVMTRAGMRPVRLRRAGSTRLPRSCIAPNVRSESHGPGGRRCNRTARSRRSSGRYRRRTHRRIGRVPGQRPGRNATLLSRCDQCR